MRNQQQLVRLPEPNELPAIVVRGATQFARRHKFVSGAYIFGIAFLLFVGNGFQLSLQQKKEYHHIMNQIDLQAEFEASENVWRARQAYQASRGWFWSCDGLCQRNQKRLKQAEQTLREIRNEGQARMSDAKSIAGIFSEVGVGEVKDSFWQHFSSGKQFAKRQSMWDALFIGVRQMHRGRDESWIEFALKVLMQVLLNFSMGLIMALVFFVVGLWSIVNSYQPNPVIAVLFFVGAVCAAFAFVASYLLAVYGAAATGVYGLIKVAESSARAQIAQQQQQRRVYDRPHYD